MSRTVRIAGYRLRVPGTPILRILMGCGLILGGLLGFLPILGFWMIPLGLVVLSIDIPAIRRWRRRWEVRLGRRLDAWRARRREKRRAAGRTITPDDFHR